MKKVIMSTNVKEELSVRGVDNIVAANLASGIVEEFMGGTSIRTLASLVHPDSRSVADIEAVIRESCRLRSLDESGLPKLIKCGDHSFAPWGTVCVHICEGTATDVGPVPQELGSETDWLCNDCWREAFAGTLGVDDIRAVCIHCLRKIMKPYQNGGEE